MKTEHEEFIAQSKAMGRRTFIGGMMAATLASRNRNPRQTKVPLSKLVVRVISKN